MQNIKEELEKKLNDENKRKEQMLKDRNSNLQTWCKSGSISPCQGEGFGSNPKVCIILKLVENDAERFNFNQIVKAYHTYKPSTELVGRRLDYLIFANSKCIGAIGCSSGIICMKPRDDFIGWNEKQRLKNLNKIANNWRFCLSEKGYGSRVLSAFLKRIRTDWKLKFNENLVLLETLIEPPYKGTCYLATGFIKLGETAGTRFLSITKEQYKECQKQHLSVVKRKNKEGSICYLRTLKDAGTKKIILVKPLHRYFRKVLCNERDFEKKVREKTKMQKELI